MRYATKHVFAILFWLAVIAAMAFTFIYVVLPALSIDTDQLVADELQAHNTKLETIIQDFTSVLSLENVHTEVNDGEISVVIFGDVCDLSATLNLDMKVTSLNHEDKSGNKIFLPALGCAGLLIGTIVAVVFICANVAEIVDIAKENKRFKQIKKEKSDVKVDLVV
ncbi:MAG: hypothetical protein IJ272_01435 [Clostridia bacterium]|nr:hypothetical protein [Clostridia bacterium]